MCYFACLHPRKQLREQRLLVFSPQLSSAQQLTMASPPPASGPTLTPGSVADPARLATPGTPAVAVPTAVGPHPLQQPLETLLALPSDRLQQALHLVLAQVHEKVSAPAASSVVPRSSLLNIGLVDMSDASQYFGVWYIYSLRGEMPTGWRASRRGGG